MLKNMQSILYDELLRLSQNKVTELEVARSNAISNTANVILKNVNTQIRIIEFTEKNKININDLSNNLGILKNEK